MKYLTIALVLGLPCAVRAQTYTEAMQAVLSDNRGYYAEAVSPPVEVVPVVPVYPNQWLLRLVRLEIVLVMNSYRAGRCYQK